MTSTVASTAEDFERLARRLAALGPKGNRVARLCVNKGIKVLRKAMVSAAPTGRSRVVRGQRIGGGSLKKSIGEKSLKAPKKWSQAAKAGIGVGLKTAAQYGKPDGKVAAKHAHLVALGTGERQTGSVTRRNKKTGKLTIKQTQNRVRRTGRMPANGFIKRATRSASREVLTIIEAEARQQLITQT